MLKSLQRSIIFPRQYAVPDPDPGAGVEGLQQVWIDSPQGPVESWYLPAAHQTAAVIFAHGNAELIDYWPRMLQPYRDLGVGVWLGEYRGYGRSAGTPSQDRIVADFVAMYDDLVSRDDIDADHVFFHGRSLGGGVVAQLALQRRPAAMILESTFTSVADMAAQFMLPRGLVSDPFETEQALRELPIDILLFHGRHDSLVPYRHAQKLAAATDRARLVTYDADHNDFPPDPDAYWQEIERFLTQQGLTSRRQDEQR